MAAAVSRASLILLLTGLGVSCAGDRGTQVAALPTPGSPPTALEAFISKNFTLIPEGQPPAHPAAVRDASGTAWSFSYLTPVSVSTLSTGCERQGAEAPTIAQLQKLAAYLGRDSEFGFHPRNPGLVESWNLDEHVLLIGTDSLGSAGDLTGIDGRDGAILQLVDLAGKLATSDGFPSTMTRDREKPGQTNFATICFYSNL